MSKPLLLNVAHYEKSSLGNGPGKRFVLWVQGCTLNCPGCMNPHTHPPTSRLLMSPQEIVAAIQSEAGLAGVTFSGGEPFQQAPVLTAICQQLRTTSLSIMAYTGYTYDDLTRNGDRWQKQLLNLIDILVDGPFVATQQAPLMWRGSRNQRVLFLTNRYTPESVGLLDGTRQMEIIARRGPLIRTGFPLAWQGLIKALKVHGVEVSDESKRSQNKPGDAA